MRPGRSATDPGGPELEMRSPKDQQEPGGRALAAPDQGPSEVPVRDLARDREERFRAIAERALQEQLDVERRISELSRRFLHVAPGDFRACMHEGLATIAGLADADRAGFGVVSPGGMG